MRLKLVRQRGTLAVVGDALQEMASKYLHDAKCSCGANALRNKEARDEALEVHITVLTPSEYSAVDPSSLPAALPDLSVVDLGVSHVKASNGTEAWYIAIYSPALQALRRSLGLPEKDLHITLGFARSDPHGNPSGASLLKTMEVWNNARLLVPTARLICCEAAQVESYSNIIVCEQERAVLEMVAVLLLERVDVENAIASRSTALDHKYINQIALPGAVDGNEIELLREMGKTALRRQWWALAEHIAWGLLRGGYLFGLRLILGCSVKRFGTIYTKELQCVCPMALHAATGKEAAVLRELNELLMTYGAQWESEKVVFYYDAALQRIEMPCLPRNFSWVKLIKPSAAVQQQDALRFHFLLAGSAMPSSAEHIKALHAVGIRHILTIHEQPLAMALVPTMQSHGMTPHHIFAIDRTPPSTEDMLRVTESMQASMYPSNGSMDGSGVLVHCLGGVGRTNTVIIAYIMRYQPGYAYSESAQAVTNISSNEALVGAKVAMDAVGAQRRMLLSASQVSFLKQTWWHHLSANEPIHSSTAAPVCSQPAEAAVSGEADSKHFAQMIKVLGLPPVLMLCGLPASGKSTLSNALVKAYPDHFVRINKDEMRGKGQCAELLAEVLAAYKGKKGAKVRRIAILDGCHVNKAKRAEWVQAACGLPVWCIHFTIPLDVCKDRVRVRFDHPTVPCGESGCKIVESMHKQYQPVLDSEGFAGVITIASAEDLQTKILNPWKVPLAACKPSASSASMVALDENTSEAAIKEELDEQESSLLDKPLKFPRTCHAVNLGAATRDDKILPLQDLNHWIQTKQRFYIEEKVDGANMGIFIRSCDQRIMVQNRSHFITPSYHPQFEQLGSWLNHHNSELYDILEADRHVLYGEWLYATHSVYYNNLPAYFIAYDIYDIQEKCFLSRDRLISVLARTTIPYVYLIHDGRVDSVDQLLAMVRGPSRYIKLTDTVTSDQREGIVIRIVGDDGKLLHRAKLVRGDFIAGNERWNRSSKLQKNLLMSLY